jgi:hypothetical protein
MSYEYVDDAYFEEVDGFDDDDENCCPACGRATTMEYCNECQEDGTEYFDRMKAAAESCRNRQAIAQQAAGMPLETAPDRA